MALRWAAAGMLAAQGQFRRVKGYQELPRLALALERATAEEPGMLDLPSALSVPDRRIRHGGPTEIQRRAGHPHLRRPPLSLSAMLSRSCQADLPWGPPRLPRLQPQADGQRRSPNWVSCWFSQA